MNTLTVRPQAQPRDARPALFLVAWRWLCAAQRVAAERRALATLDDRALADIGLDRCGALAEIDRPFWDLPPNVLARLRDGGRF